MRAYPSTAERNLVALDEARSPAARRSFDEIVQQHKHRIFRYVCRLTNDSPDAEDLTQEVFVRAYQSLHAFRHDAAIDTWLYRIATNLVIDRFRRDRRVPQRVEPPAGEPPAEWRVAREQDPQAHAELDELRRQVLHAVASLPEKLRCAVVLHDLEGLSYEEVAQALGVPVGTVKSRLFNGRALLRARLRPYLEDGP